MSKLLMSLLSSILALSIMASPAFAEDVVIGAPDFHPVAGTSADPAILDQSSLGLFWVFGYAAPTSIAASIPLPAGCTLNWLTVHYNKRADGRAMAWNLAVHRPVPTATQGTQALLLANYVDTGTNSWMLETATIPVAYTAVGGEQLYLTIQGMGPNHQFAYAVENRSCP